MMADMWDGGEWVFDNVAVCAGGKCPLVHCSDQVTSDDLAPPLHGAGYYSHSKDE